MAHLEAFRAAFDAEARRILCEDDLRGCLWSDGELTVGELALEIAEQLRAGGPWGQGFPEPVFDNVFEVVSQQPLSGGKHRKLGVRLPGMKTTVEAVAFNWANRAPLASGWPINWMSMSGGIRGACNCWCGRTGLAVGAWPVRAGRQPLRFWARRPGAADCRALRPPALLPFHIPPPG